MARPLKKGIDYFSFDVDFFEDEKIEPISGEFGGKGEIIVIRLLCAVYRNGYFIAWNEQLKMSLANRCKVSSDLIEQVVSRLVKWGFIDEILFNSAKIITSKGIQKRFQEATRKRKYDYSSFDYWLLGDKKTVSSANNQAQEELSPPITPQSKVNESILNTDSKEKLSNESKKKAEELKRLEQEAKARDQIKKLDAAKAATLKRKKEFADSLVPYVPRYGKEMIRAFYDYWSEMNKQQTKMRVDKQSTWELPKRLATWANKEPIYGKTAKEIQQPAGPAVVD